MVMLRLIFLVLIVVVLTNQDETDISEEISEACIVINCVGNPYQCIDGRCYCAEGFIPHPFYPRCIRCPGLGESCFGRCCNFGHNRTLQCWRGMCHDCYDDEGNMICHTSIKELLLITVTQLAMGAALILGILATFLVINKLCAIKIRTAGTSRSDSRLSIGSLQLYVDERLRNAPPRYSGAPPPRESTLSSSEYVNAGFVHDNSIPPPPYTPEERKPDELPTTATNN